MIHDFTGEQMIRYWINPSSIRTLQSTDSDSDSEAGNLNLTNHLRWQQRLH